VPRACRNGVAQLTTADRRSIRELEIHHENEKYTKHAFPQYQDFFAFFKIKKASIFIMSTTSLKK